MSVTYWPHQPWIPIVALLSPPPFHQTSLPFAKSSRLRRSKLRTVRFSTHTPLAVIVIPLPALWRPSITTALRLMPRRCRRGVVIVTGPTYTPRSIRIQSPAWAAFTAAWIDV